MSRQTAPVLPVLRYANAQLRRDLPAEWSEAKKENFRLGVCVMIERVLHDSDNYAGFHFINEDGEFLPKIAPGSGRVIEDAPNAGDFGHSRRQYYLSKKLSEVAAKDEDEDRFAFA